MNIRIKRINKDLPLPEYKTSGAAAFDLATRERAVIAPHATAYVPLNVCMEPPPGYYVALIARSSLHKRGLMAATGFSVMDPDYSGNNDEYRAALYNFTDTEVIIERGERIMQVVVSPYVTAEIVEVDDMGNPDRGGFGTTGK